VGIGVGRGRESGETRRVRVQPSAIGPDRQKTRERRPLLERDAEATPCKPRGSGQTQQGGTGVLWPEKGTGSLPREREA